MTTLNHSTNASGVIAVASFGFSAAIRISLAATSMRREFLHAFAQSAEPHFTSLRWTTYERLRDGNARRRTASTTKKILLLHHARGTSRRIPQVRSTSVEDKVCPVGCQMPVGDERRDARGYICQETVQHLQSAKKNTCGSRDNGTKQSEGINGSKRRPLRAVWTKWLNCAGTLQSSLILARMKRTPRRSPLPVITSASKLADFGGNLTPTSQAK
jgi:hypothetical protein